MDRGRRGLSLLDVALLVAGIAAAAALALTFWPRTRMVGGMSNSAAALKQLVNHESIWRQTDADANGVQDYWTRDVAGFHCVYDKTGHPLAMIDLPFACSDVAPGMAYRELGGVLTTRQGRFFQAMRTDQDGRPYVETGLPLPRAGNVPPGSCTNRSRFGFTWFEDVYGGDGCLVFIVNEDGAIWQIDNGSAAPVLNRKTADPETPGSGWSQYGG